MQHVADLIDHVLDAAGSHQACQRVRAEVTDLCHQFPMPHLR